MPVKFQNLPSAKKPSEKNVSALQEVVRQTLGLPASAQIGVGVTRTVIEHEGVVIHLPFGAPAVKNENPKLLSAHQSLSKLVGLSAPMPVQQAAPVAPVGAPVTADADMEDQVWTEHVVAQLFPGTLHLYQAEELYQPVLGTSGGSVYKTCFVGPELKVAARIKGSKVSFRATTHLDTCPGGHVLEVFKRLGVSSVHDNRLTCHAQMNGKYDMSHAHEYRALFGAFYAALKPWVTSNFPAIGKLAEGVK